MLEPIEAQCLQGLPGIRHGFFTRLGGTSPGIYSDLNCGFGSSDERATVAANRTRVARHLNPAADKVVTIYQVHSGHAITLKSAPDPDNLPKADAIITTTPGLVIGILTADCTPVLLADPKAGVVAAAHAGWRGAVGGILKSTIAQMEAAGATRSSIVAAIGPCIHPKNYEVGLDFQNQLLAVDTEYARFFEKHQPSAKPHFDLPGFVAEQLSGLEVANSSTSTRCTYENESMFYSYRRSQHRKEADYGRQISAIVLEYVSDPPKEVILPRKY